MPEEEAAFMRPVEDDPPCIEAASMAESVRGKPEGEFAPLPLDMNEAMQQTSESSRLATPQPELSPATFVLTPGTVESLLPDLVFELPSSQPEATAESVSLADGDGEVATRDEALQLVDIMLSLGLIDSAAQALVEHISANSQQSLHYWLRLLDIYHQTGKQEDFDHWAQEFRRSFNVDTSEWDQQEGRSLMDFPHIVATLCDQWGTPEVAEYLETLLNDHCDGTRAGFPRSVAEEILLLIQLAKNLGQICVTSRLRR